MVSFAVLHVSAVLLVLMEVEGNVGEVGVVHEQHVILVGISDGLQDQQTAKPMMSAAIFMRGYIQITNICTFSLPVCFTRLIRAYCV